MCRTLRILCDRNGERATMQGVPPRAQAATRGDARATGTKELIALAAKT